MLLLYASDLHGTVRHYEGLAALASAHKPDTVLLGGDLFTNSQPIDVAPRAQRREAETTFASWCRSLSCPVHWIQGNHEWRTTVKPPPPAGICVHGRCVPLGDWDLLGFAFCSPTPYWLIDHERRDTRREEPEDRLRVYASDGDQAIAGEPKAWLAARPTLAEELAALPSPRDWRRTVLMAHDPPFQSGLDTRYGPASVGSGDIRAFILEKKPAVSLHGHIHEAPLLSGSVMHRVGSTLGFNAGRAAGGVRALLVDLRKPEEFRFLEGT